MGDSFASSPIARYEDIVLHSFVTMKLSKQGFQAETVTKKHRFWQNDEMHKPVISSPVRSMRACQL